MKIQNHFSRFLFTFISCLIFTSTMNAASPNFDSDKPATTFSQTFSESFVPATEAWNGTKFYGQWSVVDPTTPFAATDITNGYLQFAWASKRIMYSNSIYEPPYTFRTKIDYAGGSNNGGVVIRYVTTNNIDQLQEFAGSFNRAGIAIYPADANNFYVQFSGTDAGSTATTRTKITVPKPAAITASLLSGTNILRVEDFGTTIYVYLGTVSPAVSAIPLMRIDLGGLSGTTYTSGTVYDENMVSKGTFSNMLVPTSGRLSIAQRNAPIRLYEVLIWNNPATTSNMTADKPTAPTNTVYTMDASSTFDQTAFNAAWTAVDAFTAANTTSTYWMLGWTTPRALQSKATFSTPCIFQSEYSLPISTLSGAGLIIRVPATDAADELQNAVSTNFGTVFNRSGIALIPSTDGATLYVKFSGAVTGTNGVTTLQTQIAVPAPSGVNLRNKNIWKIEDYGTTIYIFINGSSLCRINFSTNSTDTNASGSVYSADMVLQGVFFGMKVPSSEFKFGIAERGGNASDNMRIYSISINKAATAPNAPTNVIAYPATNRALVSFTVPADNGSNITSYTVTSNPDNISQTGTTSPINVSGLTNGVSYTFTVTATNSVGTSAASVASNAVMPAPFTAINSINSTCSMYQYQSQIVITLPEIHDSQTITLFDSNGKLLLCKKLKNTTKLVIENKLNKGIYYIKIQSEIHTSIKKLIIY